MAKPHIPHEYAAILAIFGGIVGALAWNWIGFIVVGFIGLVIGSQIDHDAKS